MGLLDQFFLSSRLAILGVHDGRHHPCHVHLSSLRLPSLRIPQGEFFPLRPLPTMDPSGLNRDLQYLLSQGRQAEAVATVHGLAYKNKRKTWLTEEILDLVGGKAETASEAKVSTIDVIRRSVGKFSAQRLGPLFANRRVAISSTFVEGGFHRYRCAGLHAKNPF